MMISMLKCVPDMDQKAVNNLKRLGISGKGKEKDQYTIEMIGVAALLQKVMRGDTRAYRLMLEVLGEDAYSTREAERLEYERMMAETQAVSPNDDGFMEMMSSSAEEVFADGEPDEPTNAED